MENELIELPGDEYVLKSYHLTRYGRQVDIQETIFGGHRFCLSSAGCTWSYDLNWCMGEMDLTNKILQVVLFALEKGVKLPSCSKIKPLYNDPEFIDEIQGLTGINLIK